MKKLLSIFTSLIIIFVFSSFAFADDFVVLDTFTNDSSSKDITSSVRYNKSEEMFIYTPSKNAESEIRSNIYDGMIVNTPVTIDPDPNMMIDVYKDGTLLTNNNYIDMTAPGYYKVFHDGELVFDFTIVGQVTGMISSYIIPDGFHITRATYDDEKAKYTRNYISLLDEGAYHIEYRCDKTKEKYVLDVIIDLTAPTLLLDEIKNGISSGPVDISDLEEGATVKVFLNDNEITAAPVLREIGKYSLVITDEAGNVTNYKFAIKPYFEIKIWEYAGVVLLAIIITFIFVKTSSKKIKVR